MVEYDAPGWTGELTEEFVTVWLDDWYLRAPNERGLVEQMDEFARGAYGVDAAEFSAAMVADLWGSWT